MRFSFAAQPSELSDTTEPSDFVRVVNIPDTTVSTTAPVQSILDGQVLLLARKYSFCKTAKALKASSRNFTSSFLEVDGVLDMLRKLLGGG